MKLVKKTSKLIGIILISAGTVGNIGFGTLLGVGINYTCEGLNYSSSSDGEEKYIKTINGVGALNYDKQWVDGKLQEPPPGFVMPPYIDIVNDAKHWLNNWSEFNPFFPPDLKPDVINTMKNSIKKTLEATVKAYDMMVSGAVLTSFSLAAIITSIPFIVLGKKKKEN